MASGIYYDNQNLSIRDIVDAISLRLHNWNKKGKIEEDYSSCVSNRSWFPEYVLLIHNEWFPNIPLENMPV